MKKELKEALMYCFPEVPLKYEEQMKGRGATNFVVLLTRGNELFARCFHRYYDGKRIERQRYVFAKEGSVRYILGSDYKWRIAKEFREPVFCAAGYAATFDNTYDVLNLEAIKKSCMRYSCVELYHPDLLMDYLHIYCKHPNLEYLIKAGYNVLEETCSGFWGGITHLRTNPRINWKSNNLLKMLGLNREEFKLMKGNERMYDNYCAWRENFPQYKPQELMALAKRFRYEMHPAKDVCEATGLRVPRLAMYLDKQDISFHDYEDYIRQCKHLQYNLTDTAICLPHNFNAMHERLSAIIKYEQDKQMEKAFRENLALRSTLEFKVGKFVVIQPKSFDDIVNEGAELRHCVGGYARRHAEGKLHIMFLRKADKPDTPYYTIEVSTEGRIVQCRGFKNNTDKPKPKMVKDFEKLYQSYLDGVFSTKKARTSA